MIRMLWQAFAVCLIALVARPAPAAASVALNRLRAVPVLDRGRVKPLDSLARETVRATTGKERFGEVRAVDGGAQEIGERMDPLAMLLAWEAAADQWQARPLLYVPHITLRARVGLPAASQWISPSDLRTNASFLQWTDGLMQRQQAAERTRELARLTSEEEAGVQLRHRLAIFDAAVGGRLIALLPPTGASAGDAAAWDDLGRLAARQSGDAAAGSIVAAWGDVLARSQGADQSGFDRAANAFEETVGPAQRGSPLVDSGRLALEVQYNSLRPFRLVWIGYLLALAGFVMAGLIDRPLARGVAATLFALCIAAHVAAFAVRCRITGWAPVTNMYETVVWVSLVAAILSFVLALATRTRGLMAAGAATALIASVVADVMPPEMGRQIGPLAPVLRSNYWLTIHVLTIVASYAAFSLACVLGNIGLFRFAMPRLATPESTARGVKMTYRAIQAGVLLIATGTILGGLWADVSWGRFWGWDPKEVWALIVLLVYLALLHGRFAGWVGPFGLTTGAVACFTTVLMSWYGVNFVLGAGLHSYGFGTGGQGYVFAYVLVQLGWVVAAAVMYRRRRRRATADVGSGAARSLPTSAVPAV